MKQPPRHNGSGVNRQPKPWKTGEDAAKYGIKPS